MNAEILRQVQKRVRIKGKNEDNSSGPAIGDTEIAELFRLTAQAKVQAVVDYAEQLLDQGTKFLLFAHHHLMLDSLEHHLRQRAVHYIRIDGKTPPSTRSECVQRFQENCGVQVALLSITA